MIKINKELNKYNLKLKIIKKYIFKIKIIKKK